MRIDRQRFLLIATSLAACKSSHLAPEEIVVVAPAEVERPGAAEPFVDLSEPERERDPSATRHDLDALREVCRSLEGPGPFCEGLGDTRQLCQSLPGALEPEVAEQAVDCLRRGSGTARICGYDAVEECFFQATRAALVEPSGHKPCATITSRCSGSHWGSGDLSQQSCQRALSAVRDHLDDRMIACMEESCGIRRCIYDLTR